jgi:hypothetical protein
MKKWVLVLIGFVLFSTNLHSADIKIEWPEPGCSIWTGTPYSVRWMNNGCRGTVDIVLFKGTKKIQDIAKGVKQIEGRNYCPWTVPHTYKQGSNYRVVVSASQGQLGCSNDSGNFNIIPPFVNVVDPHGGANLYCGCSYIVSWVRSQQAIAWAKVALMKGAGQVALLDGNANSGSIIVDKYYIFPTSLPAGSDYRVKVWTPLAQDLGDAFTINCVPGGKPDLVIQSIIVAPPEPGINQQFEVRATIKNQGNVGCPRPDVLFKIGGESNPPLRHGYLDNLIPGATDVVARTAVIGRTGYYRVTLTIDPNNVISESNDGNNIKELTFRVK